MKTESIISPERIRRDLQSRFNPIRGLTPQLLSSRLDQFEIGYIRDAALMFHKIEERDDILQTVIPKRKKAVSRHGYEILTITGLSESQKTEAERHKQALQYFYDHLTAVNAADTNDRGSVKWLLRQMMDAQAKRYAAFELIWKQEAGGYTAECRFIPLWFFEHTEGKLRFLPTEGSVHGVELEPGGWLVAVGQGLMIACSVAYMYKHLSLKDWVIYCQDHGKPGLQGKTSAAKDSPEWKNMEQALIDFSSELRIVTNQDESIVPINIEAKGELPYPPMVDRMDRAMAALWRGGDLSTMSKGNESVGASQQEDERDLIEEDDAEWLSETLNDGLDPWVIEYTFGRGVKPLAYIKVSARNKQNTRLDLDVDDKLVSWGVPLAVDATRERYNRPKPAEGDNLLRAASPIHPMGRPIGPLGLPNESSLTRAALDQLAKSFSDDLSPLRQRLRRILGISDPAILKQKLTEFRAELPALLRDINADPASARRLEEILSAALVNGLDRTDPPK